MKRMFSLLIILVSLCFLSCCSFSNSDEEQANECFYSFLNTLDNRSESQIKSLFAQNIYDYLEENDENSIGELLNIYEGKSNFSGSAWHGTFNNMENGKKSKYHLLLADVETSKDKYRIAIKWFVVDESDSNNVGIHSLYIIRFEEDPNKEYSYAGDGLWSNGINIGKVWSENQSE